MPKTKQDFMKRHIGHTLHNLEVAQQHLNVVRETFQSVHPQYAKLLEASMIAIEQVSELIASFAKHAWGGIPKKLQSWRNTGQEWRQKQKEKSIKSH